MYLSGGNAKETIVCNAKGEEMVRADKLSFHIPKKNKRITIINLKINNFKMAI